MYSKLPKILFKHPHTSGWDIPAYGKEGLLLFTSKEKARRYTNSNGPSFFGDIADTNEIIEIKNEHLVELMKRDHFEVGADGLAKTVVINLTNEFKYDAIYSVIELCDLIQNATFCRAIDYDEACFTNLKSLYDYQGVLTGILDNYEKTDFDQGIINEIVLWKVNRYVNTAAEPNWLDMLNDFKDDQDVDADKLKAFLKVVLSDKVRGIRLAMASTFLRFRNPDVFQIIDERMYRVVMRDSFTKKKLGDFTEIGDQIDLYLKYLSALKSLCKKKKIPYKDSDRILYQFDIIKNGDFN